MSHSSICALGNKKVSGINEGEHQRIISVQLLTLLRNESLPSRSTLYFTARLPFQRNLRTLITGQGEVKWAGEAKVLQNVLSEKFRRLYAPSENWPDRSTLPTDIGCRRTYFLRVTSIRFQVNDTSSYKRYIRAPPQKKMGRARKVT